jgi:hypothetical protein
MNPPEFVQVGLATLDAYATAVLASDLALGRVGPVCFLCALTRFNVETRPVLIVGIDAADGPIEREGDMVFLTGLVVSFMMLLAGCGVVRKTDQGGPAALLEPFGPVPRGQFMLQLSYPGRMIAEKSPYLKVRTASEWPSVTLVVEPTEALRARARGSLAFFRDSGDAGEVLN